MPSVIRRYLSRELLQYWLVMTTVLWLVLVVARFSLYLGQAASGRLPADTVIELLALKSVGFFVFLMPLTLFLAILWLLGRLNQDFESLALAASGVGVGRLYAGLAAPVLLVAALVAVLSTYLVPETAAMGYELRAEAQRNPDIGALAPGRFHVLHDGQWLLFAERAGEQAGTLRDLFIHVDNPQRPQVLVAAAAHLRTESGGALRYLVLEDGYRYDGVPGQADYRVLRYQAYALRLQEQPVAMERKWDAVASAELWNDDSGLARAEWQMRVSRPVSVVVLALIALPLARFRPTVSRYYPLWLGMLVFTLYFNLLTSAQLWLGRDQVPAWLGVWWVHVFMLAALGGFFALRRVRR